MSVQAHYDCMSIKSNLEIFDLTGRKIQNQLNINTNENIKSRLIANNIYIIHLKKENKNFKTKTIIK